MPTKRRTESDYPRHPKRPDTPVVEAAADTDSGAKVSSDSEAKSPEPPGSESEQAEAPDPERRVQELVAQLEEVNSARVRLAADFENYKKRARQEQVDTMRYAAATVAERLLPVLDDADRALSHAPDGVDESWLTGVRMTFKKLEDVIASVGVERIDAAGRPFDPKVHEAVGSDETTEQPEDTVVAVLRNGYRIHDRVLRPALVRVARPPAELPAPEGKSESTAESELESESE